MIHCVQWKKINDLSMEQFALQHASDAWWALTRGRGGRLREDGCVAIKQRNARLYTIDRYSDMVKDPLQSRTFNLKQRTIEEAGYAVAVLRPGDLRKVVVVRAGNQP